MSKNIYLRGFNTIYTRSLILAVLNCYTSINILAGKKLSEKHRGQRNSLIFEPNSLIIQRNYYYYFSVSTSLTSTVKLVVFLLLKHFSPIVLDIRGVWRNSCAKQGFWHSGRWIPFKGWESIPVYVLKSSQIAHCVQLYCMLHDENMD